MRTWNDDREIDLIVEKDRRLLAIEVKLATTSNREHTAHARWLADRPGSDLDDAMIVTTGHHAYRDRDGITVVPAALREPEDKWIDVDSLPTCPLSTAPADLEALGLDSSGRKRCVARN